MAYAILPKEVANHRDWKRRDVSLPGVVGVIGLHGAGCAAGRSHAACTRCTAADLALSCGRGRGRGGRRHARVRVCLRRTSARSWAGIHWEVSSEPEVSAARQWATHVPLHRGPAMAWYTLGRETERVTAGLGHVCVLLHNVTQPCGLSMWRSCT
jgi:hypothetical protein